MDYSFEKQKELLVFFTFFPIILSRLKLIIKRILIFAEALKHNKLIAFRALLNSQCQNKTLNISG